ncbi:Cysteine-rich secretory protein family protein [Maribacter spongiicola]|uniref:Cysteine-rich secretory protein family protein n=1 Tax=Maribacter spongiicola TaxID=1206753 RepID=A0A4V3EQI9_9FLAO|nr:CAP domain-containing protein [Maribacter spongiicola]TDT42018.1 Cysteine-rich secretory protein family protein [Maribacter spongiicola]
MKMRLLYAVPVFLLLFLGSCTSDSIDDTPVLEAENVLTIEQDLLDIVNAHRLSLKTNTLIFSDVAYKYANLHTDYMISKGSISHDNFSSRASNIDSEISVEMVAENVAKDYQSALEAFEGWYVSSSHKKTMEGDFTHTGISVKKDDQGNYYFTQLFYKQ